MESDRFGHFTRRLGATTTRRTTLELFAALGSVGVARVDAAAGSTKKKPNQCGKATPCPACQHCSKKHHTCKPLKDGTTCSEGKTCQRGACVCATGTYLCASANTCCANGTACAATTTCGVCPTSDFCRGPHVLCGQFGPNPTQDLCLCTTSVQNTTTCTSGFAKCVACTTDAECTTALGAAGLCVDGSGSGCTQVCDGSGGQPDTHGRRCVFAACTDFSGGVTTTRRGNQRGVSRIRGFGRTP